MSGERACNKCGVALVPGENQHPSDAASNSHRCKECRRLTGDAAAAQREYHRARYHRAAAEGLCPRCSRGPPQPGKKCCAKCNEQTRSHKRNQKSAGVCGKCGAPAVPGQWTCYECDVKQGWYLIESKYGLTREQWEDKLISQSGRCAICNDPMCGYRVLHVDHCHSTGAARDLLCGNCNHLIGKARDNPSICIAAADYLIRHAPPGSFLMPATNDTNPATNGDTAKCLPRRRAISSMTVTKSPAAPQSLAA